MSNHHVEQLILPNNVIGVVEFDRKRLIQGRKCFLLRCLRKGPRENSLWLSCVLLRIDG